MMTKTPNDWLDLATKETKGNVPKDWQTDEGIAVKPLYTRDDLAGIGHLNNLPGFSPFVRGPKATMYAGRPWTIRQ
ncbi:MAG: methylmalonyl-CoA mutase family protein, partial [Salaquimonas sp.]